MRHYVNSATSLYRGGNNAGNAAPTRWAQIPLVKCKTFAILSRRGLARHSFESPAPPARAGYYLRSFKIIGSPQLGVVSHFKTYPKEP
jgi:hypothetical protein